MRTTRIVLVFVSLNLLFAGRAWAVPAFARQTGMSCASCHTVFPELTPFGRQFKAGGYTQTMTKQITDGGTDDKRVALEMPANVPLGVMMVGGYSATAKAQQVSDGGPRALNGDWSLPQQFSIFYAGKVAPEVGAFIQLTYEGAADAISFDNTDIRFAHPIDLDGHNLILGATVNNSPTVSDLYNSTPAWGVPFTSSASAPTPAAATLLEGGLAQSVAGGGVYGSYTGAVNVYAELQAYRSAPLGVSLPLDASTGATNVISGAMPYWRLAVEEDIGPHSIAVGTFGLTGTLQPGGTFTDTSGNPGFHPLDGTGDRFTDLAADAQYQYITDDHIATATFTYIHEAQSLKASQAFGNADNAKNDLTSIKASASYIYARLIGARATYASITGSADATLYGGQGPGATALSGELFFTPWYNTKLGMMYTAYTSFDGATTNYDGAGRNAADNNTLYGYLWLAF